MSEATDRYYEEPIADTTEDGMTKAERERDERIDREIEEAMDAGELTDK